MVSFFMSVWRGAGQLLNFAEGTINTITDSVFTNDGETRYSSMDNSDEVIVYDDTTHQFTPSDPCLGHGENELAIGAYPRSESNNNGNSLTSRFPCDEFTSSEGGGQHLNTERQICTTSITTNLQSVEETRRDSVVSCPRMSDPLNLGDEEKSSDQKSKLPLLLPHNEAESTQDLSPNFSFDDWLQADKDSNSDLKSQSPLSLLHNKTELAHVLPPDFSFVDWLQSDEAETWDDKIQPVMDSDQEDIGGMAVLKDNYVHADKTQSIRDEYRSTDIDDPDKAFRKQWATENGVEVKDFTSEEEAAIEELSYNMGLDPNLFSIVDPDLSFDNTNAELQAYFDSMYEERKGLDLEDESLRTILENLDNERHQEEGSVNTEFQENVIDVRDESRPSPTKSLERLGCERKDPGNTECEKREIEMKDEATGVLGSLTRKRNRNQEDDVEHGGATKRSRRSTCP